MIAFFVAARFHGKTAASVLQFVPIVLQFFMNVPQLFHFHAL